MSEVKKEFASAIKWLVVIIIAATAYNFVAPEQYYFTKHDRTLCRCNVKTGKVEFLDVSFEVFEWVNITESELSRMLRTKRMENTHARFLEKTDPLSFLDEFIDIE